MISGIANYINYVRRNCKCLVDFQEFFLRPRKKRPFSGFTKAEAELVTVAKITHVKIKKNETKESKKRQEEESGSIRSYIPGAAFLVCLLACFIIWQNKKRVTDSYRLPRSISSDPSSNSDIEGRSLYMGIPIFSYTDLVEATNDFDSSRSVMEDVEPYIMGNSEMEEKLR